MIYLSAAIVIVSFLAFVIFSRKLQQEKEIFNRLNPIHPPLDQKVLNDLKLLSERIVSLENTIGLIRR